MQKPFRGKTSLVTGASSGLGADFARELARLGSNLVLTARREEQLRALQAELTAGGTGVTIHPLDLAAPGAPQRLFDELQAGGVTVDVLVNNAGFGAFGPFAETPWEREKAMLDIDITALVHMTKLFLPPMLARGDGRILQVSSIGAFQPSPTYGTYAAAKSFVLSFGEALNHELRGTGVSCTVVCPGVTATEFLQVAGQSPTLYQRVMMMRSQDVVRAAVRAKLARRSSVVPGLGNALTAFAMRFIPRSWAAALAHWSMSMR
jgi:short-subunit dehydrogenase